MASKVISFADREFNLDAIQDPSSAQLQLWLAQMKRGHSQISDREMAKAEMGAQPLARKSRTLYNPFTGEIRKEYL